MNTTSNVSFGGLNITGVSDNIFSIYSNVSAIPILQMDTYKNSGFQNDSFEYKLLIQPALDFCGEINTGYCRSPRFRIEGAFPSSYGQFYINHWGAFVFDTSSDLLVTHSKKILVEPSTTPFIKSGFYVDDDTKETHFLVGNSLSNGVEGKLIFEGAFGGYEFDSTITYPGGILGESIKTSGESEEELAVRRFFTDKINTSEFNFLVTGQFTGTDDLNYTIEIDAINSSSYRGVGCGRIEDGFESDSSNCTYFKWSDDEGATWEEEEVLTQEGWYDLNNEVKFTFNCPGGSCNFSVGDTFTFTAITSPIYNLQIAPSNEELYEKNALLLI